MKQIRYDPTFISEYASTIQSNNGAIVVPDLLVIANSGLNKMRGVEIDVRSDLVVRDPPILDFQLECIQ